MDFRKELYLESLLDENDNDKYYKTNTNISREIIFCIDHCIHHLAIIKIGLKLMNIKTKDDNIGISPSTLKHRKICAP